MADTKKYKINRVSGVNSDGSAILETVHPETEAGQVLYSNTIGTTAVTNVDQALGALATLAQNSGVTGVKGSAESSYRNGNVNLTPANIGAVASNTAITGGTFTKISYDSKGLVTKGENATLDDIADGTTRKLANYIPLTQKGKANGVATLTAEGKVPTSQLPSYVDDVIEGYYYKPSTAITGSFYEDEAHTKLITPEAGKIYIDLNTHKTYRWGGISSGYVEISASLAPGEVAGTAYPGDKGAKNRSDIDKLQGDIDAITDGDTSVGYALNAGSLGGETASNYALKTDVPAEAFFVVTFIDTNGTWTSNKTFSQIRQAVAAGKLVIGRDNHSESVYHLSYEQNDGITFSRIEVFDNYTYVESLFIGTNNSVKQVIDKLSSIVTDTGSNSGAVISQISENEGAITVTRRAMTNADLPTVSGLTAGSYSLVSVNAKGIVTGGNQLVQWGTSTNNTPSATLAVGGLFFELVE